MDRNFVPKRIETELCKSLSARRAWIEIAIVSIVIFCIMVALRKESVDRNLSSRLVAGSLTTSLSARRAWIEIKACIMTITICIGRSPQGERG